MGIIKKVKNFLKSEDKWFIVSDYVQIYLQQLKKNKYSNFGKRSVVEKPIRLIGAKRIEIGDDVSILKNSRIEIVSMYHGVEYKGFLRIGSRTSIGQNFHCTSGGNLEIGKDVTISGNVLITNIAHEYKQLDVHILEQELLFNETKIGDGCFIGFGAVIQPGAILGKQCVVGSNAVVMAGNYPDFCVIVGCPAKIVKQYDFNSKEWKRIGN